MPRKYFSVHHRFLAWLGRLTNTIILVPHPESIGNASEDYYYGLLKARREGKRLVVLFPFEMPGRFRIRMFDPALLFLESDLLAMRYRSPVSLALSGLFTLYFLIAAFFARLLIRFVRFNIGYYWRPLAGQDILWRPTADQMEFDWALARDQDWGTQFSTPLELSLPKTMTAICEAERARIGLPSDAWFVCLHVREGGYKGDWDSPLNADINNYLGAIKEIVNKGGWVVRMGDPSMTKLPISEKVIDYAHSPSKSAIMDIYLVGECRFYVGSSTSLLSTAFLLNKPMVITNQIQMINSMPIREGDITIFRQVYSKSENRFLSLQEWISRAAEITGESWSSPDWQFFENSEEEIRNAVKEMMDLNRKKKPDRLQMEFRSNYMDAIQKIDKTLHFDSAEPENCSEWYRHSSIMLGSRGTISTEFLEQNWLESQKTTPPLR